MDKKLLESAAGRIAAQIDGAALRGNDSHLWRLLVTELKPVRSRVGWLDLAVALRDDRGESSRSSLAMGLVSGGGRLVKPWFELRIYPDVEFGDGAIFDARAAGLEAAFIDLLGKSIPPGGHLMIEYESPGQSRTHAELLLRVPPAATHLGSLMFHAGFRGAFKDWYISEGGHEGPRKLQANKSPTPAAARSALRTHRAELGEFVKRALPQDAKDAAIVREARARAQKLLCELPASRTRLASN
ncbi:MAG: DUF1122 family protein [Candidatus Binataceae bacterium]